MPNYFMEDDVAQSRLRTSKPRRFRQLDPRGHIVVIAYALYHGTSIARTNQLAR